MDIGMITHALLTIAFSIMFVLGLAVSLSCHGLIGPILVIPGAIYVGYLLPKPAEK